MEKPSKTQPARVIRVRLLIERIRYGILYLIQNVSLFYLIWQLRGVAMSDLLFLISCGSMVNGYES